MNKMCRTNTQDGRSMIEMLGVLAIIGVLSVGGIAGYSKAMMKFKINKTIDQISQIVANTKTLYASQRGAKYSSLGLEGRGNQNKKIMKKAKLIPAEMYEGSETDYSATNVFGGVVNIELGGKNDLHDGKAFVVYLGGIPEEACIELSTMDWGSETTSGLIALGVGSSSAPMYSYIGCNGGTEGLGTVACPGGANIATPMPVDVAVDACEGNNNFIALKFH